MINIEARGVQESKKALQILVQATQAAIKAQIARSARSTESEAKRLAPVAFDRLRPSIGTTFAQGGLEATVSADVRYARWVEGIDSAGQYGRRPGKWPPDQPIRDWVILRGLPAKWFGRDTAAARDSATFLVRRKIGLRGTRAQPFLFPAYSKELPKFQAELDKILTRSANQANAVLGRLKK